MGWGMPRHLGGGLISGLAKHHRIDEAQDGYERRSRPSRCLRASSDVREFSGLKVDISRGWTFADFLLDGAISDIVVQSKDEDAQSWTTRDTVRDASRLEKLR